MANSGEKSFLAIATQKLKEAGFRVTEPRKRVIQCLAQTKIPLSAYRLKDLADESGITIDTVSIYRTLSTLESLGIIHRVHASDGFMPCTLDCHVSPGSEHAICDDCGNVIELRLPTSTTSNIQEQVAEIGFKLRNFRVEIEGQCENCEKNSP